MTLSYETTRRITRGSCVVLKNRNKQIEEELSRLFEISERCGRDEYLGMYGKREIELLTEREEIEKALSSIK